MQRFLRTFCSILWPAATFLVAACSTTPKPQTAIPIVPAQTIIQDPGKIAVMHGSQCGQSKEEETQQEVLLSGSWTLPNYANQAVVVLNGWRLRFLDDEQEIRSFKVYLENPSLKGKLFTWKAKGYIANVDFDEPYELCYYYTTIAWNDAKINVRKLPLKGGSSSLFTSLPSGSPTDSSLNINSSYVETQQMRADEAIALLPQGFGLGYSNKTTWTCFDCPVEHEVLQMAFGLGRSESFRSDRYFISSPQTITTDKNIVDSGYVGWDTHAVLRDQEERRNFWTHEYVSFLAGADLQTVEPAFSILPAKPGGGLFKECPTRPGPKTQRIEIKNVPFQYAVPLLTGWDLSYRCSDEEEVKYAGLWLDEISYDSPKDGKGGTLRYKVSSLLYDDDDVPYHDARHSVTILGLKSRIPADLLPRSTHSSFCRRDTQGRLLIDIANIGAGDAPASTTRVTFLGGATVDVATPPVAKGFRGPLKPITIPPGCQQFETCTFTVKADAGGVVTETNEANNTKSGKCAFPK